MNIAGIQQLSLIDYPCKPCSIVFTQGCVFRCSYCHNPDLIPFESKRIQQTESVLEFLKKRKAMVDAVCITGGEPTTQQGLVDFITVLKERGFFVKLDTNGIRPDVTGKLIADNLLDYIAMDLKAPWHKYLDVIKKGEQMAVEACKKTFRIIQGSGVAHEFRTTFMPGVHTRDDFFEMAGYLQPGERYFMQKTSFKKTLEPLEKDTVCNVYELLPQMRETFPLLTIGCR
jgi:pyruvate formate lyase activating enzyme